MPFEYAGAAKVSAVNLKKEGPDHDKVLAVEIAASVMVDRAFMANFDPTLGAFLWDGDAIRFPSMGPVGWTGSVRNMEIEILGLFASGVALDRFEITPLPGESASIEFRARWRPEANDVAIVSESLVEPTVDIKLTLMPALDFTEKPPLSAMVKKRKSRQELA